LCCSCCYTNFVVDVATAHCVVVITHFVVDVATTHFVVDVATARCKKFVAQAGSKNQVLPKKYHQYSILVSVVLRFEWTLDRDTQV